MSCESKPVVYSSMERNTQCMRDDYSDQLFERQLTPQTRNVSNCCLNGLHNCSGKGVPPHHAAKEAQLRLSPFMREDCYSNTTKFTTPPPQRLYWK